MVQLVDFTNIEIIIMASTVSVGLLILFETVRDIALYVSIFLIIVFIALISMFGFIKTLKFMWNF